MLLSLNVDNLGRNTSHGNYDLFSIKDAAKFATNIDLGQLLWGACTSHL